MAKIVKKKKKRVIRLESVAMVLFTIATVAVLFSSLFVRTQKNYLTMQIEDLRAECASLEEENTLLNSEINELISVDRIYEIATSSGLSQDTSNVINVTSGE